jgi:hypothetical protein
MPEKTYLLKDLDVNEVVILKHILKKHDISDSGQAQCLALVNVEMNPHVPQMAGEFLEQMSGYQLHKKY